MEGERGRKIEICDPSRSDSLLLVIGFSGDEKLGTVIGTSSNYCFGQFQYIKDDTPQ